MDTICWGIIGCGDVTEIKSGPALQETNGSKLVAVMRRNGDLAKDYAKRHNVPKWYDDANALIHDSEVNAVYIATPPSSHKEYTLAVAKAKKAVYVEKPMAANHEECLDMIRACEDAGIPLFVAYYRRALPRFLKIKSLLDDAAIGKVRFVNITLYESSSPKDLQEKKNWRINPEIAGAGYFYDLASHMLDILQFYFGKVKSAHGFATNQMKLYPAEDIVSGCFLFESGIHGTGTWNFSAYGDLDRTEIIGDKGKLNFSTFGNRPLLLENSQGVIEYDIKNPLHIQQPLIQSIALTKD